MILSSPHLTLPQGYDRIKIVGSFDELVTTPFADGINALCWPRTLSGDFSEVVEQLGFHEGILSLDQDTLESLPLTPAGRIAADILLQDEQLLRGLGLSPNLDCIQSYPRDEAPGTVPTDVYSFHADSATVAADTYLCSYNEVATEGLRNEQAIRRIDIPEVRAALLEIYGGVDDADFLEYLYDNCFHLHYAPCAQAQPFSFGLGHFWRIAVDYPGSPVPPCLHRAPETSSGQSARLLLIS